MEVRLYIHDMGRDCSKSCPWSSMLVVVEGHCSQWVGRLIHLATQNRANSDFRAALLFFILFFYVFEVQFLMQIIINRISIISERKATARRLKIGTAVVISLINAAVFCIFIPSHLSPPPSMM